MFTRTSANAYFELAYALRKTVHQFPEHVAEWERMSDPENFAGRKRWTETFGEHPRQTIEILKADGDRPGKGLAVFIHGGFWRAFVREQTRFMAQPFLRRGWDCALTEYRLMPEFRLADLVADTAAALSRLAAFAETGKLAPTWLVAGHSAGAHLALHGMEAARASGLAPASAGLFLLSGVFDIFPVSETSIGDELQMDRAEVARWSIYDSGDRGGLPAVFALGGEETEDFKRQTYIGAQMLGLGRDENVFLVDGANHMTLLTRLATDDALFDAVVGGLMKG